MKTILCQSLPLFALLVQVAIAELTELEANYFTDFNGLFSNEEQGAGPNKKVDLILAAFVPVVVSALGADPMMLFQEGDNGNILRVQVRTVKETSPGVITSTTYNVTKQSLYKGNPAKVNIEEISSLTMDDLVFIDGCVATFELEVDKFVGAWEDCLDRVNGHFTHYVTVLECDFYRPVPPSLGPEKFSILPYHMNRITDRYPLIGAPKDFVSICDKKKNNSG